MTQMRKALLLPLRSANACAVVAAQAAGIDRRGVPGWLFRGIGIMTGSDRSGAGNFRRARNEMNPARQARETPI